MNLLSTSTNNIFRMKSKSFLITNRCTSILAAVVLCLCSLVVQSSQSAPAFRPPAVPLVTSDPYLSIWSEADHLTDDATRHWTHHEHSLSSLIRVDGKTYRLMGNNPK